MSRERAIVAERASAVPTRQPGGLLLPGLLLRLRAHLPTACGVEPDELPEGFLMAKVVPLNVSVVVPYKVQRRRKVTNGPRKPRRSRAAGPKNRKPPANSPRTYRWHVSQISHIEHRSLTDRVPCSLRRLRLGLGL